MNPAAPNIIKQTQAFNLEVKKRSDRLMDYFLGCYFFLGLVLAQFYSTWIIAISVGSICMLAYYSAKIALPDSSLYQYVLSAVLGIFMAQFIYQMHGLFEMHFFAFIGSALLIMYQQWKLQIPIAIVVALHHGLLGYLQDIGYSQVYFTQLNYFDVQTFAIHVILAAIVFFICGLWAYQLRKTNENQIVQIIRMSELENNAQLSMQRVNIANALEERNTILESITDAFFAVDHNWMVTYWNNMAEKELRMPKHKILHQNLWEIFADSIDSESYRQYQYALNTPNVVHFEDYYAKLEKWYEISAYPSANGLSVYFKDITQRKLSEIQLTESEKRYSDLFHLSPLPMWVFETETTLFLDVNEAAIKHYGYTRNEFLSMSIKDIRPKEDRDVMDQIVDRIKTQERVHHEQVFKHCTQGGHIIYVDIQSTAITFKGKQARIVLANDVTERLNYLKTVEEQNEKLKKISWMQSHMVRAPLAKIIGLVPLITNAEEDHSERDKMLDYLLKSAQELDEVIANINLKSEIVEAPKES